MYPLAIFMHSLEKSIFRFSEHFSIRSFVFGCWVVWAVCVLWQLISIDLIIYTYFLQVCRFFFFHFVMDSFAVKRFISFIRTRLLIFGQSRIINSSKISSCLQWQPLLQNLLILSFCNLEQFAKCLFHSLFHPRRLKRRKSRTNLLKVWDTHKIQYVTIDMNVVMYINAWIL